MSLKTILPAFTIVSAIGLAVSAQSPRPVPLGDWPEMRGPARNGSSAETGLPDTWDLSGQNLAWRVPHGGRSAPVIAGNRIYVQNPAGRGAELQERVMALDAETGRTVWEYRFNIFQSDVPPHRVGWASPAIDPGTGNVYALSGGAQAIALSPDGKLLWQRSFGEEFAAFTTHGGRTMSPIIDGDLVIVSAAVSNWGQHGNRAHRFIALDKRSGEVIYVAHPGGRPYDTAYAAPFITTIGGRRLLIAGLGDGAVHAIKPQTGEKVWSFVAAKRAVNTGVVTRDNLVFMSHGDENLDTTAMGMIGALDGSATGDIKAPVWAVKGVEFGYSSPVIDGTRLYQIDNGSTLHAYDTATGKELWSLHLGNGQKAPAVLADGKIYVGTEGGEFFIVRPGTDKGEILSRVELPISTNSCCGSEGTREQVLAGAAVSRGRVYFVSSDAVYAIGVRQPRAESGAAPAPEPPAAGQGEPAHLQISPTELVLAPGDTVKLRARLFDAAGRLLRETPAEWTLEGLKGTVGNGAFTVAVEQVDQAGLIKATAGGLTGQARARVSRALPWSENFESYAEGAAPPGWVNIQAGKMAVALLDGNKVLQKPPDDTIFKRIRAFIGPTHLSNYSVAADVRAATRRRQTGDVGITAQRYSLVLYGTAQRLKIESWEPETTRTVSMPFKWEPDTWYRLKLQVENLPNGSVRARGKAWPAAGTEPDAWTIEKVDPIGPREGAPGLFIDAQFGAMLDNFTLTANPK